jgi:branched-chain amino acid transport system substrate-binding protein
MSRVRWLPWVVVALLSVWPVAPLPAAEPFEINAILSMTGAGAFIGTAESRTLNVIEDQTNRAGGVRGRSIRFHVWDDQSNPQVSVQIANALIAAGVAVIVGPTIPATCLALQPLVEKNGPLMFCLNPSIHPAAGSFAFSAGEDSTDVAVVILRYLKARGFTRIASLHATDASGADLDRSFETAFALPEMRSLTLVAHERFNPTDVSVSAQIARIKAANPQALLTWTAGTPLGTVLRGAHDGGLSIPIVTSGGNMNLVQIRQYASFMPPELLFSAQIAWTPGNVGPGPIRDAQRAYDTAIRAAGYQPDAGYTIAWDPAHLVIDAYRRRGFDASAAQVRDAIVGLHGWIGIDGVYDFAGVPQRGLDQNAAQVEAWDAKRGDFIAVSTRGGRIAR